MSNLSDKYNTAAFAYASAQLAHSQSFKDLNPEEQAAIIQVLERFMVYYNDALYMSSVRQSQENQ